MSSDSDSVRPGPRPERLKIEVDDWKEAVRHAVTVPAPPAWDVTFEGKQTIVVESPECAKWRDVTFVP